MFWVVYIVSDRLVFVPSCLSVSEVQVVKIIKAASLFRLFMFLCMFVEKLAYIVLVCFILFPCVLCCFIVF